jgi:tetratricopeptide (TPR) repeat protein
MSPYAFILAALIGCAGSSSNRSAVPHDILRPGYEVVYYPEIRTDANFNSAKKDLEDTIRYLHLYPNDCPPLAFSVDKTIVHDNRLEMGWTNHCSSGTGVFLLPDYRIFSANIAVEYRNVLGGNIRHEINFPDLVSLEFKSLAAAKRAADALLYVQDQGKKAAAERSNKLAGFASKASQYRALAVKPTVSEAQRRLIVQANALNQQKNYGKAIAQYLKVIALDPTSYPSAYFNLALLSAQANNPLEAIFHMKHYLLLEPIAKDARSAQDKIYEWELMTEN